MLVLLSAAYAVGIGGGESPVNWTFDRRKSFPQPTRCRFGT